MPRNAPTTFDIKRIVGDTHSEKIRLRPAPEGLTSAVLEIEDGGTIDAVVSSYNGNALLEFIPDQDIADLAAGTRDFKVVVTAATKTRTVVQGSWIVEASTVP